MNNLRRDVRRGVFDIRDRALQKLSEYSGEQPNVEPYIILDEIINYCLDKSVRKDASITSSPQNHNFQLIREGYYPVGVGIGDEETMKRVLKKIESLTIPNDLEKLRTEATRISELFNIKLKSKIAI